MRRAVFDPTLPMVAMVLTIIPYLCAKDQMIEPTEMNPENHTFRKAVRSDAKGIHELVQSCITAMQASGIDQWDELYPNLELL